MDQYEVRRWTGWYDTAPPCRTTGQALAVLVQAFLALTKCYAAAGDAKGGGDFGPVDPHDGARGATAVMPAAVATLPER